MRNLHRVWVVLIALVLFAGSAAAQIGTGQSGSAGPLACTANAAGTPQLRSEGYTELIGDVLITCTGGTPLPAGSSVPTTNITVYVSPNAAVTSRLLSSATNASEALLLIDDPGSTWATGVLGPFGPRAPQVLCTTLQGGCPAVVATQPGFADYGATSYEVMTAVGGGPVNNVYQGVLGAFGPNSVTFYGVPVLPPVINGVSRTFRITNIRISTAGMNNYAGIKVFLSTNPSTVLRVAGGQPVGVVMDPGLVPSVQQPAADGSTKTGIQATSNPVMLPCNITSPTPTLNLLFKEGFYTAFKTRVIPMSDTLFAAEGANNGSQNIPGGLYGGMAQNSESGFILPNARFGEQSQYAAGLADFGTRLKAVFTNIPTGVTVYVSGMNREGWNFTKNAPVQVVGGMGTKSSAVLVYAGGPGSDAIAEGSVVSQSYVPVALTPNATGTATAIWEVTNSDPANVETFTFTVYIAFGGNPIPLGVPIPNVAMSLAPEPGGGTFTVPPGPVPATNIIPRTAIAHGFSAPYLVGQGSCGTPVPAIISVSPSQVAAGTGPLSLNITGSNFVTTADKTLPAITWAGAVTGVTTYLNSTNIKVLLPSEALAISGAYFLQVVNPVNVVSANGFTVVVNPVLTRVEPSTLAAGGPDTTLTITGGGFTSTDAVYLGSTRIWSTYVGPGKIVALVPSASLVAGVVQVKVADAAAGTSSATFPLTVAVAAPKLTYLNPPSATCGGPAVTVTLVGSGFTPATGVNGFGNLPVTLISPTQLTVTLPANLIANCGRFSVSVSNPGYPASAPLSFLASSAVKWSLQKLEPSTDDAPGENFGMAVSISGDTAVVGASFTTGNGGVGQGAASVFTRSGGVWTQQQILTASDGQARDYFGHAVALSGDTAIIYAPLANSGDGAVYVFVRTGAVWTQQQKFSLPAGSGTPDGWAMGISGDTLVVGTLGVADVYARTAGVWSLQQHLTASDGFTGSFNSVSISGDTVVLGAPDPDFGQGAAYVFVRRDGVWTEQQKLTASDGRLHDEFGSFVSASGETVLIAAAGRNFSEGGVVYAFVRNGSVWTQQQELAAPGDGSAWRFGNSLSVSGDTAVISTDAGGAYASTRTDGIWSALQDLAMLVPAAQRCYFLAQSVSVSGNSAVFGASTGCAFVSQSDIPPPFFAGSVNVGESIQYLQFPNGNLFGYYSFVSSGWIFHVDLGYEYVSPGNGTDVYLWDMRSGHWWYTNASNFPYLYDFNLKSWIFYFPNTHIMEHYTSNPRYFANMTTGQTFPM